MSLPMDIETLLASIPTLSAAEVASRIPLARHYTLVFLRQGPASRDDQARNERLQLEH